MSYVAAELDEQAFKPVIIKIVLRTREELDAMKIVALASGLVQHILAEKYTTSAVADTFGEILNEIYLAMKGINQ